MFRVLSCLLATLLKHARGNPAGLLSVAVLAAVVLISGSQMLRAQDVTPQRDPLVIGLHVNVPLWSGGTTAPFQAWP